MVISTKMAKIENLAKVEIWRNFAKRLRKWNGKWRIWFKWWIWQWSPKLAKIEIRWQKVKNTVAWSSLRLAICGKHDIWTLQVLIIGLAALVNHYVKALSTPGAIPNVQRAWNQFVETKCSDPIKNAVATYDALLKAQLSGELPCDSSRIRVSHDVAFQECEDQYMADIVSISSTTVEIKMRELKVRLQWAICKKMSVY